MRTVLPARAPALDTIARHLVTMAQSEGLGIVRLQQAEGKVHAVPATHCRIPGVFGLRDQTRAYVVVFDRADDEPSHNPLRETLTVAELREGRDPQTAYTPLSFYLPGGGTALWHHIKPGDVAHELVYGIQVYGLGEERTGEVKVWKHCNGMLRSLYDLLAHGWR